MCKLSIRILLPIILLSTFVTSRSMSIEPPPERDIITVAILGDRTGGDPEGLGFLDCAIYELNQIKPDFVIHIGDMVQGYTREQNEWLRQYEEFMSYMRDLSVKWYPVAGNHDVFSPTRDPGDRTYEKLYEKYFAPLRYSFDYKNSHFVIMYTDEAMTSKPVISAEQMDWLRKDLEAAGDKSTFIFLHKPVWRYEDSNWDEVHEIIKDFPVKAVTAGHFHAYQKDVNRDGIQYYLMGVTGGEAFISEDELTGWINHYNLLRIDGGEFTMAVVKLGNVEADDYILAEDYNAIWTIGKLSEDKTGLRGWLWQPTADSVEGEIEVYAHNPLDTDIPVEVQLNLDAEFWSMEPPVLRFLLLPDSDMTAKVTLASSQLAPEFIVPPELELEYTYTDSHGGSVPVVVRRRVFLRDTHDVYRTQSPASIDGMQTEPFWEEISPLYNHTWIYSVYERPDLPPEVYLAADDANLYFFAEVMDDKYSYLKENPTRGILSDAIVFSTQIADKRKDIVIFPFNEDGTAFLAKDEKFKPSEMSALPGVEYTSRTDQEAGYYYCEGKIPLTALFGDEPLAGKDMPFNVGVIDNDLDAFIYIRAWAFYNDPQYWGILKFAGN